MNSSLKTLELADLEDVLFCILTYLFRTTEEDHVEKNLLLATMPHIVTLLEREGFELDWKGNRIREVFEPDFTRALDSLIGYGCILQFHTENGTELSIALSLRDERQLMRTVGAVKHRMRKIFPDYHAEFLKLKAVPTN